MSLDISGLLNDWKYQPNRMQARLIEGDDGRGKLQIRLDLGLFQLELDGRPDGQRPEGAESLLDHLEIVFNDLDSSDSLAAEQLGELMREGVQYYNRYMALFTLGEYDRVARDTDRNLRLFRFVGAHVESRRDHWAFEQYRPFVTMMHGRALGEKALRDGKPSLALRLIDEAMEEIHVFFREHNQEKSIGESAELNFLRNWREEIEERPTSNALDRLEEQLSNAVALEDFEEAARLRDLLRILRLTTLTQPATEPDPDEEQKDHGE